MITAGKVIEIKRAVAEGLRDILKEHDRFNPDDPNDFVTALGASLLTNTVLEMAGINLDHIYGSQDG